MAGALEIVGEWSEQTPGQPVPTARGSGDQVPKSPPPKVETEEDLVAKNNAALQALANRMAGMGGLKL